MAGKGASGAITSFGPRPYASQSLLRHSNQDTRREHVKQTPRRQVSQRLRVRKHKARAEAQVEAVEDSNLLLTNDLRQAISDVNIKTVIMIFPEALQRRVLDRSLVWRIAQCLHEAFRREKRVARDKARREDTDELIAFTRELVKAIKSSGLLPDRRAHLHLLAIFKESGVRAEGVAFWKWLELQDDQHTDPDVYGAAIELLAVDGASLADLEALYEQALQRFPGSFNAYHLSPNAILTDRDQRTEIKGVPMTLLQGILTARLLRGDSRNAYLALDTAIRLYPTITPPRFFSLFIDERPVEEAYTVFAIACRAGIILPFDTARKLLAALRTSSDLSSLTAHLSALRQMVLLIYMYVGAGGRVSSNAVNEMIIGVTQLLRLHGIAELAQKSKKQLVETVMGTVRKMILLSARLGVKPGMAAINSIITNLGGYGESRQIIGIALKAAEALDLEPTRITFRSIMASAGLLGDGHLVGRTWQDLADSRNDLGGSLDMSDFLVLLKAAKMCRSPDLVTEALKNYGHMLREEECEIISERLHDSPDRDKPTGGYDRVEVGDILSGVRMLEQDLDIFNDRTDALPGITDYNPEHLPILLSPLPDNLRLAERAVRHIYDELTTEQRVNTSAETSSATGEHGHTASHQGGVETSSKSATPALNTADMPLGTLRYENWKVINYLLALAESNDKLYHDAVHHAISSGVAPPTRERVIQGRLHGEKEVGHGLSDARNGASVADDVADPTHIESVRAEIIRLRAL
ncbi:hypothetical protein BAUCODRAFT_34613 [Baudoinia panamericana UAMH 10762]|uniref:Uncharacterized protein n=1 Tax=Baudoinia panamericana (strain UAMH 10762) TaxID=717646 RepID=M2LNB9_BAUPA|nr:uncharacterized protein BAUCODRAFT_34613 [Baudoinia panamericana UAMH 10762]EMC95847.1 hypothetical protein BAUCODRAFT_34613 [Baudoinia panamericana UAMH 10762]